MPRVRDSRFTVPTHADGRSPVDQAQSALRSTKAAASRPVKKTSPKTHASAAGPIDACVAAARGSVSRCEVEAMLRSASAARAKSLAALVKAPAASLAPPEDGSLKVSRYYLACTPGDRKQDALDSKFVQQMAAIGREEGFAVMVKADAKALAVLKSTLSKEEMVNVLVLRTDAAGAVWLEDAGELSLGNEVEVVPTGGDPDFYHNAVVVGRLKRMFPEYATEKDPEVLARAARQHRDDLFFGALSSTGVLGAADCQGTTAALAAFAAASGKRLRQALGYIEGGNHLIGHRENGEPMAIVGQDTLAVTRAVLERDLKLKRRLSDDDVLRVVAKDLGVKAENVIPVDQPGVFHVDMAMMVVAPGVVVVNDSREAFALQHEWAVADAKGDRAAITRAENEHKTMRELFEKMAVAEDRAAEQLAAAGLKVYRLAGAFMGIGRPAMNFINGELGTNAHGEKFMIALGGDPRAEAYVRAKLTKEIPAGLARMHFLDRSLTSPTLAIYGGIACRAKAEGTV